MLVDELRRFAQAVAFADVAVMRTLAHDAFDPLWERGRMTRREAYEVLAKHMGMHPKRCHIRYFTPEQCAKVVEFMEGQKNA